MLDVVIVGSGPCGSLAAAELTARGASVAVIEAGPRFRNAAGLASADVSRRGETAWLSGRRPVSKDQPNQPNLPNLPNSEANAARILWNQPRVHTGPHGVVPKTGIGVGGGTLAWLGVMPRFHRADFRTRSTEGVGADWPIGYDDLRPFYEKVEREFGVAGECGPFAPETYRLPMPPHRMNWHAQVLARGAQAIGAHPFAPPIAINSVAYDGRPACCYCGWCASGCGSGAKATAANTYLARAEQRGATVICDAFVHRVTYDAERQRVTGVEYLDANGHEQRVLARAVVIAAHAVETPRLLLMSANGSYPDGLANSSGEVGRRFMSHPTWQVFGTFDDPINAYKGMQMGHVMVQDYYAPDPRRGCARGFVLLSYMMTPITYANLSGSFFGADFKQFLFDYTHTAAWWAHAEGLPDERNTVTLSPTVKDARGLPVAEVTYAWGDNDATLAAAARDKAVEMMNASGARRVRIGLNYGAHAMGSCRMGGDPRSSVVNDRCQSHDIPNLFICDTSVFVTGAGLNPTLTAMAITSRAIDHLASSVRRGDL